MDHLDASPTYVDVDRDGFEDVVVVGYCGSGNDGRVLQDGRYDPTKKTTAKVLTTPVVVNIVTSSIRSPKPSLIRAQMEHAMTFTMTWSTSNGELRVDRSAPQLPGTPADVVRGLISSVMADDAELFEFYIEVEPGSSQAPLALSDMRTDFVDGTFDVACDDQVPAYCTITPEGASLPTVVATVRRPSGVEGFRPGVDDDIFVVTSMVPYEDQ